ncbi:Spc97/Spc98 family protein [Zalerion maritima]|uniref:Spindle pole body component n=1 Tax=Zalerion maritima TaxID=339359 RepID=A0AAD5RGN7_9PEZI|nr:Spc97/Spc98 family protein [Zalerion maritima]
MSDKDASDVFAIPDFETAAKQLAPPEDVCSFFSPPEVDIPELQQLHLGGLIPVVPVAKDVEGAPQNESEGFFKLPPTLDLKPVEETHNPKPAAKPEPRVQEKDPEVDYELLDSWLDCGDGPPKLAEYRTWDLFAHPDSIQQPPLFISETGPGAFDAALAAKEDPLRVRNTNHKVIETKTYCACLLALALGRGSILFSWEQSKRSFVPAIEKSRISGVSAGTLKGVQETCVQTGNATHFLRTFVEKVYKSEPSPSRVALATAVDKTLLVVQSILGERGQTVRSVLHLESLVRPVHSVLVYFRILVMKLYQAANDEEILSILYHEAQAQEYGEAAVRDVVREVLWRVSQPWLSFVEEWIGIKVEEGIELSKDGPGKSFVKVENRTWVDDQGFEVSEPDYALDETKMPSFMAPDIAQKLFETGKNLRFLKTNHPHHPLCKTDLMTSGNPPKLEWKFGWEPIRCIEAATDEYERSALSIVERYLGGEEVGLSKAPTSQDQSGSFFNFLGKDRAEMEAQLAASIAQFNDPVNKTPPQQDRLNEILGQRLYEENNIMDTSWHDFSPHSSLVPVLSFGPLITVQSKLMDRECMRLLFSAHNLREHLELQRDFQLMGNGLLCSRLSHALFDPDLETAERQHGVARKGGVMGLRLSGRDTWPPASSELRLALMGVLAECYLPQSVVQESGGITFKFDQHKLPGDLSFAVRDLTPEEIDACMDPDSIAALDFLRLSYKAPSPLAPIITPRILAKYDRIFRLSLRVLRMLYVVNQLFKDVVGKNTPLVASDTAIRFRIESHHFITSLSSYFFDTGIAGPWESFSNWLDSIQNDLAQNNPLSDPKHIHGPERLREFHERVLDQIMMALMLRKRQAPVMKLLEEIFGLILKFGKIVRLEVTEKDWDGDEKYVDVRDLYKAYKQKVDVFVTVCRGLSEKGGFGVKTEKELLNDERSRGGLEENVILRLLVRLEMRDYYASFQIS